MLIAFAAGLVSLLVQAFVPFGEFVQRGDDAYYYFQLAVNYPRLGFWSFDGIEPTNGVQPLWAMLLTTIAQVAAWCGVTDVHVLDRVFVAAAALVQFAAAVVLFRLLAARVSVGTAIAAAGGCLFPLGLVWGRLWGMESPLLALALVSTVAYYHLGFLARPTARRAAVLGLLLGLTGLARLNAGLLIPCLLVFHVLARGGGTPATRVRHALVAGVVATAVLMPYFAWNVAHTGAPLPVSGRVKAIGVAAAFRDWGVPGRWSWGFLSELNEHWHARVEWFVTSRLLDGLWIAGVRVLHDGAATWRGAAALVAALLVVPAAFGPPAAWLRLLRDRFQRLAAFAYFAVYAALEAVVAVVAYPTQTYAIPRWWLVSDELLLGVLGATLGAAALGHVAERVAPARWHGPLATAGLALLVTVHGAQSVAFYWGGRTGFRDWNLSWGDETYRAAQWMDRNVPADAVVGAWNAGALAYYGHRQVVNLDGLVNNAALLPYLRDDRLDAYVLRRGIRYLSDMDGMFDRTLHGRLALTEVYRHHSALMNAEYRIYRVDGPTAPAQAVVSR